MSRAALSQTRRALADAGRDARAGWTPWHTAAVGLLVLAALVPLAAPSWLHLDSAAAGLYRAVAATGLLLAVGLAGMPSLGQGAFMGIGAFALALLAGRGGWPVLPSVLVATAAAAAAGVVAGMGVVRLRPVFVAVTTWILTWLLVLFLLAFPSLSGGSQGIVVPQPLPPAAHYELALVLLVLSVLAAASLSRGRVGTELRAVKSRPAAAAALGVPAARRRLGAFVASAAVAGLAGALSVQLAGVADAGDYGPFRSFELFVAVLIGGAASVLGPAAGVAALGALTALGSALGALEGAEAERFDPMLASLMLLTVLALGGSGIVPALRALVPRGDPRHGPRRAHEAAVARAVVPARLEAARLAKRFGSVAAADAVTFSVRSAEICALIGPNGSGKTTVLRMLAGTSEPDGGRVLLDGRDVTDVGQRERALAGVIRTLQSTSAFEELTALENVTVGAGLRRRNGGALRTLLATPAARIEDARVRGRALAALDDAGLGWAADVPAGELSGPDQRLVAIAAALAAEPRVLLLDEPSAGGSLKDVQRLVELLVRLRASGVAILLVEHNLRLVRSVADRVIVMAAGRVIADGAPHEVAASDAVRTAYLGRHGL